MSWSDDAIVVGAGHSGLAASFAAWRRGSGTPQKRRGSWLPLIPEIDLAATGISTMVWAAGHRPCFDPVAGASALGMDEAARPAPVRGVTSAPRLYFMLSDFLLTTGDKAHHVVSRWAKGLGG